LNLKKQTVQLLRSFQLRPQKRLGQNFLINDHLAQKFPDFLQINEDDLVFEIGTGLGNLTKFLLEKAGFVVSCEIDARLFRAVQDLLGNFSNLELLNEDFLKIDLKRKIESHLSKQKNLKNVKLCGNLPYYITSPILEKIIENRFLFSKIVLTLQKEVAQRIIAKPGTSAYGSLSIFLQFFMEPKILAQVKPGSFFPSPAISSCVISLESRKQKIEVDNEELFFIIVRAVFSQRRKTLLNSLYLLKNLNFSKADLEDEIRNAGFNPQIRGEELSIEEFARLSNCLANKN
jgi:16S rRNA (adenine1518-N6/adenine1519-N6)-dimethyltransferase